MESLIKVLLKIYLYEGSRTQHHHHLEQSILHVVKYGKTRQCPCGTHLFPYEIFGTKIST